MSIGEAATVPYAWVSPFACGDGVETRLTDGGERVDAPPFATGTTAFPAGFAPPLHRHNYNGQIAILDGRAQLDSAGVQSETEPMDTCFILACLPHRIVNIDGG